MKVHVLRRIAGPAGNFGIGAIIDVSPAEAAVLVEANAAEYVDRMAQYQAAEPEPAPVPEPAKRETAEDYGAKRRRKAVDQ